MNVEVLEKTNSDAPFGINYPNPMPPFGSPLYRSSQVKITVQRDFAETRPAEWFIAGVARSLARIVLLSTGHPLSTNEKAVDLTAMILGYQYFIAGADKKSTDWANPHWLATPFMLLLGFLFIPGRVKRTERMSVLSEDEALFAWNYLDKVYSQYKFRMANQSRD